mmetsp:Transcript_49925/g.99389  ORF Transcript_49925/g.99389 Transcript_49925/m.99389 type:complete len:209 (-) Transcript_49925:970-1596(-)
MAAPQPLGQSPSPSLRPLLPSQTTVGAASGRELAAPSTLDEVGAWRGLLRLKDFVREERRLREPPSAASAASSSSSWSLGAGALRLLKERASELSRLTSVAGVVSLSPSASPLLSPLASGALLRINNRAVLTRNESLSPLAALPLAPPTVTVLATLPLSSAAACGGGGSAIPRIQLKAIMELCRRTFANESFSSSSRGLLLPFACKMP